MRTVAHKRCAGRSCRTSRQWRPTVLSRYYGLPARNKAPTPPFFLLFHLKKPWQVKKVATFVLMDNSNERRKQWVAAHPELVARPSMKRRKAGHDYCSAAIYMVTLCVEGRRPILGTLNGPDDHHAMPWVYPSQFGLAVMQAWHEIPQYHPQVKLLGLQLMPDHVHAIIHVTATGTPHPGVQKRLPRCHPVHRASR